MPLPPTKIYVASAGTGKTTILLNKLEEVLTHTPPERIVYTTYTNAGANEAIERACSRFNLLPEQFPYFRTLHSLCYRNVARLPMLNYHDYKLFGESIHIKTTGYTATQNDGTFKQRICRGDALLALDNYRRNKLCSYEEAIQTQSTTNESAVNLRHFAESLRLFKEEHGKIDFTDQLEMFLKQNRPLDVDYVFVDESQDFSALQWQIIRMLSEPAKELFVAGDDKQAIYEFSGAAPQELIDFPGERILLDTTYRLPQSVMDYSTTIANRIAKKTPYTVKSFKEAGTVQRVNSVEHLDLNQGSWFFLIRNRLFADFFENMLFSKGLLFTACSTNSKLPPNLIECIQGWTHLLDGGVIQAKTAKRIYEHYLPTKTRVRFGFKQKLLSVDDSELLNFENLKEQYGLLTALPWDRAFSVTDGIRSYILSLQNNKQLLGEPRIEVATIHSVKGKEADNVVILPDMSYPTQQSFRTNPDAEHRCFYVAATRARINLYLHAPLTENAYPL